ncbi:MAG TPA: choice-of-anchor tandem repeat GloVer-containing protein [Candidatus Cybelea sp.]|nr:choice-of-anchor tandem repeat GloVer-containing protein [Candidatus Cybelea sp.]
MAPCRSALAVVTAALLAGCTFSGAPSLPKGQSSTQARRVAGHGYSVAHFFTGRPDGAWPTVGRLVSDKAGNLYGATNIGGTGNCKVRKMRVGCGTIFDLSPSGTGWTERVLYSFKNLADGAAPYGTVTLDSSGDIYGVTMSGGNDGCLQFFEFRGCGTAFELVRHGKNWKKRLLHTFSGGADGGHPRGNLILDEGTLYGTAHCGGGYSCYGSESGAGAFFALRRSGMEWNFSTLFAFGVKAGGYPTGDLTPRGRNTIYGTNGAGVYAMSRSSRSGSWHETTVYFFPEETLKLGSSPTGGLVFDAAGNIYGTTSFGGGYYAPECSQGCGVVYELSPSASGSWSETVLHAFTGGSDGGVPAAGLAIDADGSVFGTTENGGDTQCNGDFGCGVVFSVVPHGTASTERVLHTFEKDANDGGYPLSAVTIGARNRMYGTTWFGGPGGSGYGNGTVYEIAR